MYLIFIFHLHSPIGGAAPRDSVSSGLFMLDLLEALLNLQREKRICPTAIPLDEVRRSWVTFQPDYGFSCVLGLAIEPVLSQFPICKTGMTVFPSLTRNRPLLRYYPKLQDRSGICSWTCCFVSSKEGLPCASEMGSLSYSHILRANWIREDK